MGCAAPAPSPFRSVAPNGSAPTVSDAPPTGAPSASAVPTKAVPTPTPSQAAATADPRPEGSALPSYAQAIDMDQVLAQAGASCAGEFLADVRSSATSH